MWPRGISGRDEGIGANGDVEEGVGEWGVNLSKRLFEQTGLWCVKPFQVGVFDRGTVV